MLFPDSDVGRNGGFWTPQEAADFKKSLERIATENFGNLVAYINKDVVLHLENVLQQRDEVFMDMVQKKAADIKSCILEESNETQKALEDNLEQEKQCQIRATSEIIKSFNETKATRQSSPRNLPAMSQSQKFDNFSSSYFPLSLKMYTNFSKILPFNDLLRVTKS